MTPVWVEGAGRQLDGSDDFHLPHQKTLSNAAIAFVLFMYAEVNSVPILVVAVIRAMGERGTGMPSAFGWLDQDDEQRRAMLQVVELFKDEGTVDEIGIGPIRDGIANLLFPGTSVLHTRLRYLLFIPWLLAGVAQAGLTGDQATAALRRREIRLIYALLAGGEVDGVIGQAARDKLKRMPSVAYWAALRRFEIRRWDTSIEGYFRRATAYGMLSAHEPHADDPGITGDVAAPPGLDPHLPPAPADLLTSATFAVEPGEAEFLVDRLSTATPGSLLCWLTLNGEPADVYCVWEHHQLADFPSELQQVIDQARRFHHAIHGAALLYNLLLAERAGSDALLERYLWWLDDWRDELGTRRVYDGWDLEEFWDVVRRANPRISVLTQQFVNTWLNEAAANPVVEKSDRLRALVRDRELQLKGGRARLVNNAALDSWQGDSGLVRLDYRWTVAHRLLSDLYAADGRAT